jgi:hypothetical protein
MSQPVPVSSNASSGRSPEQADMHDAFYGALIDKVRQDKYPSKEILDMIEQGMWGHERSEIIDALIEKIREDRYPSLHMLRRLARLVG